MSWWGVILIGGMLVVFILTDDIDDDPSLGV